MKRNLRRIFFRGLTGDEVLVDLSGLLGGFYPEHFREDLGHAPVQGKGLAIVAALVQAEHEALVEIFGERLPFDAPLVMGGGLVELPHLLEVRAYPHDRAHENAPQSHVEHQRPLVVLEVDEVVPCLVERDGLVQAGYGAVAGLRARGGVGKAPEVLEGHHVHPAVALVEGKATVPQRYRVVVAEEVTEPFQRRRERGVGRVPVRVLPERVYYPCLGPALAAADGDELAELHYLLRGLLAEYDRALAPHYLEAFQRIYLDAPRPVLYLEGRVFGEDVARYDELLHVVRLHVLAERQHAQARDDLGRPHVEVHEALLAAQRHR